MARNDDIRPRIMCVAADLETWAKVEPAMFETIIQEEMEKYEKFKEEVNDLEENVRGGLQEVKVCIVSVTSRDDYVKVPQRKRTAIS